MTGIELIAQERKEQLQKGRSVHLDFRYNNDQQLRKGAQRLLHEVPDRLSAPYDWDVDLWQKMCGKTYKERLIIVGALIAAELDRIQMAIDEDSFQQNITTNDTNRKRINP